MSLREAHDRHEPILAPLERLIRRGQETGNFDCRLFAIWPLATVIALGKAVGVLQHGIVRVFGVTARLPRLLALPAVRKGSRVDSEEARRTRLDRGRGAAIPS